MQDIYTAKARRALRYAERVSGEMGHQYVGTEHLLMGLVNETASVAGKMLGKHEISVDELKDLIETLIAPPGAQLVAEAAGYTPRLRLVLEESREIARSLHQEQTGTEHMLLAILKDTDSVASRLLSTMGIPFREVGTDILTAMGPAGEAYREELEQRGRQRNSGRPSTLEQYSRDLTALAAAGKLDPCIGRDEEIQRLIQILSRRTKNNPCLVGEPGVGKTAIAEGLALRIARGSVPDSMKNKRVMTLDLSGMVAGTKYRGEFEERIKKLVAEVTGQGNILLFLDELHTIIGAGGAEGAIDASSILKPSLARGELQLIGATTAEEYRKYIEKDAALERRFQPVSVEEPDEEKAIAILKGIRGNYEKHHQVVITDEAVEAAVRLSRRYISDRFLPDKAIDLMDEAAARMQLGSLKEEKGVYQAEERLRELQEEKEEAVKSGRLGDIAGIQAEELHLQKELEKEKKKSRRGKKAAQVGENEIAAIVSDWTKIPVQRLAEAETERLRKLESILHKRVIAQEEAVKAVAKAVKRGRVGLKDPGRPIGSFLFLGPTGVGKTELSKALAEVLFGREQAMIRVDMSEYMEKHSVSKLIGAPPGYVGHDDGGQLSEKVRRNPYAVILFDEIEKAHPDVFNILLQVLDDGHITDSQGRKVDFKNTVIIMTSNAGAGAIVEPKRLGFAAAENAEQNYRDMKAGVMEEVKRLFKPEFLNRIDEIIVFHALEKEHVKQIAGILLKELKKRCKSQLNIELNIRSSARDFLVEKGYDSKYGARPLKRAIQTYVEDGLAEEILEGRVKEGGSVDVTVRKGELKFIATVQP